MTKTRADGLAGNPLAERSTLPFGLPPFGQVRAEHFAPAFEVGMAEQLAEVAAITRNAEPADFGNTVVALERSGQLLSRAARLFFNLVSSDATQQIRDIESEFAPRLAAHSDQIRLDTGLFARIDAVHAAVDDPTSAAGQPTAEDVALIRRYHLDFVLAGARLDATGASQLRELNQRISRASTRFQQNLQEASEAAALIITEVSELDGLSDQEIGAAAAEATARGHHGRYLIPLMLSTGQPLLSTLRNRDVRRRLHQASVTRASTGEFDNGPLAVELATLRAQRARLLGFGSHADAVVVDQTAGSSAAVDAMLAELIGPARVGAAAEAEILSEFAAADGVELAAWDWAFYAEQVRAQRYSVDVARLRPYFSLERVLHDGVFFAATQVYGITFTLRPDLAGYHPDVRVWEVGDADGSSIGLYLGDFFARAGKRGGAWMNSFVDQSALLGEMPVVVNNLNITKPASGVRTLLTPDEVNTLFHEFGHALHGLFSAVTYPRLSGTSVPRDFVEFPSQVNEMWRHWPEVLANYAVHVDTAEQLPQDTVEALIAAELWGQGFGNLEYLAATLLDQAWHRITPETEIADAADFEYAALRDAGLATELIPPRYRSTYFQHIFAGGYSAGYYSYVWSEVLDADTVEWFRENGGMTRRNGDIFRSRLLAVGGSVAAMSAFRAVRGRDADLSALLRRRGLRPD